MGNAASVLVPPPPPKAAPPRQPGFRFESLVLSEPTSLVKGRSVTLSVSLIVHSFLIALLVLVPLLWEPLLPAPGEALRAFFVSPPDAAPPPPPPPPPPAGARSVSRAPAAPRPSEPGKFVAPVEIPETFEPELSLDLGIEGGVPGGVEGGVPGGVVGGIVGGLPEAAPPPPPKVVRIGGQLVAPKLAHVVTPVYPPLAAQARMRGVVILEAQVDTHGAVKSVKVLRGLPLFDEAAIAAVKQWRYQPLLLNGVPTEFILTVTVNFHLASAGAEAPQ